jgi:hypothetical protein
VARTAERCRASGDHRDRKQCAAQHFNPDINDISSAKLRWLLIQPPKWDAA